MTVVALPYNIQPGDDEDADQVMANFNALKVTVNGDLTASDNVSVATAVTITGQSSSEGDSTALARANHQHTVRGIESLTADPTISNFVGRLYYNSSDNNVRLCTSSSGSGTFVTVAPLVAADLVAHAINHGAGGSDPLPDNTITNDMMGRTIANTATMAADVFLGNNAYTDLITGISVTCSGTQVVTVTGQVTIYNVANTGGVRASALRLMESTTEVACFGQMQIEESGSRIGVHPCSAAFTATDGAHTYVLQGASTVGNDLKAKKELGAATTPTAPDGTTHTVTSLQFVVG